MLIFTVHCGRGIIALVNKNLDLIAAAECPKCGGAKFKRWDELDGEQKMLIEKLPASAEFSLKQRKQHSRWCTRCFYEDLTVALASRRLS